VGVLSGVLWGLVGSMSVIMWRDGNGWFVGGWSGVGWGLMVWVVAAPELGGVFMRGAPRAREPTLAYN
jgi:hypothetical protein